MAKGPASIDKDHLKAITDVRDVAQQLHQLRFVRSNGKYDLYHAPDREDNDPSFKVYVDGFHDFASTKTGDVYALLMLVLGCDFQDALLWLHDFCGRPTEDRPPKQRVPKNRPLSSPRQTETWREIVARELADAQAFLWSDHPMAQKVRRYLREQRGLTDETIRAFKLGFNRKSKPTAWTYQEERTGKTKSALLPPGILIPWYEDKQLVALRIRRPVGDLAAQLRFEDNGSGQKYELFRGSIISGKVFGAQTLSSSDAVLIVEGEFDLMLAHQILGDRVAVITTGSASGQLSEDWINTLSAKKQIASILDTDNAGIEATHRLTEAFGNKHRPIQLPHGKDITEFVMDHDGDLSALYDQLDTPVWWPQGVPDAYREAILNYFPKSLISLVELLNSVLKCRLINPMSFTAPELQKAGNQLNIRFTIRNLYNLLDEAEGVFVHRLTSIDRLFDVNRCTKVSSLSGDSDRKIYQILPIETVRRGVLMHATPRILEEAHYDQDNQILLAKWTPKMLASTGVTVDGDQACEYLNALIEPLLQGRPYDPEEKAWRAREALERALDDEYSKPLPVGWPIHNGTAYRTTWARAIVLDEGEKPRSIATWMKRLGVKTHNTVGSTLKSAGIKNEAQFTDVRLEVSKGTVQEIETAMEKQGGRRIKEFFICKPGQTRIPIAAGEAASAVLAKHFSPETTILCNVQIASKARIVSNQSIKKPRSKKKSDAPSETPKRSQKRQGKRTEPFYGPGYDPAFLDDQIFQFVARLGKRERATLAYLLPSGQIWQRASREELIRALLQLAEIKSDPLLATAHAFGAKITNRSTGEVYNPAPALVEVHPEWT